MQTHLPQISLLALGLLLSCDDATGPTPCEQASAKVSECFGTELGECDDDLAKTINEAGSCEEISGAASVDEKADGTIFCPSFLWWLCGDEVEAECAAAGNAGDYDDFRSEQRMAYHWEWAKCTEYGVGGNPELSGEGFDVVENAAAGVVTSGLKLGRSFSNSTDELDRGRIKLFHPFGSVAKVEFVASQRDPDASCAASYTGIFAEERIEGFARLSWGSDPRAIGYLPGAAIKFFIEGEDSVNLHAVSGLAGKKGLSNFFEQSVSNVLPPDASLMGQLARLLGLFVENPDVLNLEHLARFEPDGSFVSSPHAPFEVTLAGSDEALSLYNDDPALDFRDVLREFPVGTVLYDVIAQETRDGCEQHLGTVVTTTRFIASQWGDEKLHFQHPRKNQEPIIDGI